MKITTLILFFLLSTAAFSQAVLAPVQFQDINKKSVSFPSALNKKAVVILTFSQKASDEIATWVDPLYQKFIAKSGMMDGLFDASLTMLSFVSASEMAAIKMNSASILKDLPPEFANSVLYTTESPESWKQHLNSRNDKTVYILVISPDGKILKQLNGSFSEDKMDTIEDAF